MPSISEAELNALEETKPKVLTGEIVEEEEEFLDPEEELIIELKATRDVLRSCLIMLYFFDTHVDRITKRERILMGKQGTSIEKRLEEIDQLVERMEDVE